MKRLCAISVLSFLMGAAVTAQDKIDCRHEGLVGPVKAVESGRTEYSLVDGKGVEGPRLVTRQTSYDEQCDRTEMIQYGPDGKILERLVYTYDALGRNIGFDEFSSIVDKNLTTPRKHVYVVDSSARIIEYKVLESDGSLGSHFTYEYDTKGNKLAENFYTWTGTRGSRVGYTYDDKGHQLSATCFQPGDTLSWKTISSYNTNGRRIEWSNFQAGILRYKIESRYDQQGRISEEETFEFNAPPNLITSHSPVPGKVTYTYSDSDRTKEVTIYLPSGTLKSREIRTTDEKGNETSRLTVDENGSTKNIDIFWFDGNKRVRTLSGTPLSKFEYDAHGNWTKHTRLIWAAGAKEPEPWNTEYRIITYY
jgi:antitoxin component YwqK of YwqJK toxin-antitoxin module